MNIERLKEVMDGEMVAALRADIPTMRATFAHDPKVLATIDEVAAALDEMAELLP